MTSGIDMNSVLLQMRAMAARAEGLHSAPAVPQTGQAGGGFGTMFRQAIEQVNSAQQRAIEMSTAAEVGATDADIADVMLAMQKASLGFQTVLQVRNKVVAAYQEIMNMQV
ncbi:MAG: Flagellar hook-basal body complex protein FliE [Gammaproteobacteria bacterium]|nr:Flagellar hook-basal body complex protein FliE [Gammaproteobacteria bacterium]